jgi:4-nitrophenyl phosphatase
MIPENIKSLILDMDGVLWRGDTPIGDLSRIFVRINNLGLKYVFATNNGSRTPDQYVERLVRLGVQVEPWQVVTSSLAVAHLLSQHFPSGGSVFAIGEDGLICALRAKGFDTLPAENASKACAVVMGIDRGITFEKMVEAALLVQGGIPFYATNPDRTFPTPRGEIPGAGAWISVISSATGEEPVFAGKPAPDLLELARSRLGTEKQETLVVGDRLETDIAGGQAAGMPVALVLSGVSTLTQGKAWRPEINILASDLASLIP